jgi:hypothetical protein
VSGGGSDPELNWSGLLIWGDRVVSGGLLRSAANAWPAQLLWGSPATDAGEPIQWGVFCVTAACDATSPWTIASMLSVADVNGLASDGDTVVWGTTDGDTVVWGTTDGDTVVWGTSCTDPSCEPVLWNR